MRVKAGSSYLTGDILDLTRNLWHLVKKPNEQQFFVSLESDEVFGTDTTAQRPKE